MKYISNFISSPKLTETNFIHFDRFNFTVNEAEPLEKEVAIDPEMLGKVFENLIEENRRKGLGSYYTPREIVHYMCEQSLVNYLATELEGKVLKEDLEKLIFPDMVIAGLLAEQSKVSLPAPVVWTDILPLIVILDEAVNVCGEPLVFLTIRL